MVNICVFYFEAPKIKKPRSPWEKMAMMDMAKEENESGEEYEMEEPNEFDAYNDLFKGFY